MLGFAAHDVPQDPSGSRGATKSLPTSPGVGVPICPSWAELGAGVTSVHLAGGLCGAPLLALQDGVTGHPSCTQTLLPRALGLACPQGCFSPTASREGEAQVAGLARRLFPGL